MTPDAVQTGTDDLPRLRIGISACLLGERVRFDGGHKRDAFLIQEIGRLADFVPVCPEVGAGMGTPRESVQLVGKASAPRMVGNRSGKDWTDALTRWSDERLDQLAEMDLHGFVLKKDSPSCGLHRVRVYGKPDRSPAKNGRGLFAERLARRLPLLPLEEEGRLNDPRLREGFVDSVFTYARFRRMLVEDASPAGLVRFHTRHKLTILAHSPKEYRELGRMVADAGTTRWETLVADYGALLMRAMGRVATIRKHTNVLEHLAGHLKRTIDGDDRAELVRVISEYRQGVVPLVVPMTLLGHHVGRGSATLWAQAQTYLAPYPPRLMIRNTV